MFANIGEDFVINNSEILAIIDYNVFMKSTPNKAILELMHKNDRLVIINDQVKKSVIILEIDGKLFGIISPISTGTLSNRFVNFNMYFENLLVSEGD
ncbi:extracellular matrix regulator RemB [Caldicellulosiruptoraceae bacterium PP1]